MKAIIYKQDSGILAVIHPTPEAVAIYGIEAVALKDVPGGKRFKIIDVGDLPEDRSQRASWTVDDDQLTDGVGAPGNDFLEVEQ